MSPCGDTSPETGNNAITNSSQRATVMHLLKHHVVHHNRNLYCNSYNTMHTGAIFIAFPIVPSSPSPPQSLLHFILLRVAHCNTCNHNVAQYLRILYCISYSTILSITIAILYAFPIAPYCPLGLLLPFVLHFL